MNGRAGSAPGVAVTVAAPGAPRARVRAAGAAIAISLVGVGVRSTAAFAAWSARGPVASATAAAQALPRVAPPTATNTAYGTRVTVSWAAATYPSGSPVPGYVVRVADAATGVPRPVGGGCAGRVETLSCDETGTPDGRWRYTVAAVDGTAWSGADSTPSPVVTVDTTPPTGVSLSGLPASIRAGQVLGASASDAVTGVASVTYLWCAGAACTPQEPIGTSSAAPGYPLTWTNQPPDGTYRIAARAADGAGNSAQAAPQAVTIDNHAPVVALGAPADGVTTTVRTVVFTGSGGSDEGDASVVTVRVYAGAGTSGPIAQTLTATRTGATWSVTSAPLDDGRYTVLATQGDAAGNAGTSAPRAFTIDATAPAVVAVAATNAGTLGKLERNDTIRLTFGEALDPTSVPATSTLTVTNVNGSETIDIPGITDGPCPTGAGGAAARNRSTTWNVAVAPSAGNTVLTVTVTSYSAFGSGTVTGPGTLQLAPAHTLRDVAGNGAAGLFAVTLQLF
ncbi:MAG TPA: Ig-like domain-containing protein [Acidimicrobiia bacterium]|nr:Ig-like domain-containing protein [Acidimicrobiia bacterium]